VIIGTIKQNFIMKSSKCSTIMATENDKM